MSAFVAMVLGVVSFGLMIISQEFPAYLPEVHVYSWWSVLLQSGVILLCVSSRFRSCSLSWHSHVFASRPSVALCCLLSGGLTSFQDGCFFHIAFWLTHQPNRPVSFSIILWFRNYVLFQLMDLIVLNAELSRLWIVIPTCTLKAC